MIEEQLKKSKKYYQNKLLKKFDWDYSKYVCDQGVISPEIYKSETQKLFDEIENFNMHGISPSLKTHFQTLNYNDYRNEIKNAYNVDSVFMKKLIHKRIITSPDEGIRTRNIANKTINSKTLRQRPLSPQEVQIRKLISSRMVSPKSAVSNEEIEQTNLFEKIKVYYKEHKIRRLQRDKITKDKCVTKKMSSPKKQKFIKLEEGKKKVQSRCCKTRNQKFQSIHPKNNKTCNIPQSMVICKSPMPIRKEEMKEDIKEFLKGYYPKIGLVEQVFGKRSEIRSRRESKVKGKLSLSPPILTNIKLNLVSPNPQFRIVDKSEYLKEISKNAGICVNEV